MNKNENNSILYKQNEENRETIRMLNERNTMILQDNYKLREQVDKFISVIKNLSLIGVLIDSKSHIQTIDFLN